MPRRFVRPALALLAALLAGLGCQEGPNTARVTGKVKLDGKNVETGTVQFFSVDNSAPSAAASIKDGAYEAQVPVGKVRAQISSPKVVGKRKMYNAPDSPVKDVMKESIPAKYNSQSQLTREVKPGENSLDFELTSR